MRVCVNLLLSIFLFPGQDFEAKSKSSEETLRNVKEEAADSASKVRLTNHFCVLLSAQHYDEQNRPFVVILLCLKQGFSKSIVIMTKILFF